MFTLLIINTWNSLPENVISAKDTEIFEHRLDNYWKDQDLLCNYESNLTTGEEIEIDDLRWTFSNAVICFFLYGFQTELAYSR
jgi:hypothetical protein